MKKIIDRLLKIKLPHKQSAFLFGPRKTGKSYWLHTNYPNEVLIDLLKTDVFAEYAMQPSLLRQRYGEYKRLIIIDEVQLIPDLLKEIHWMIENTGNSFLLTGSSVRKLRRKNVHLLGGRAWSYHMQPLTYFETSGLNLEEIMTSGLLPPHFLSTKPINDLRAYTAEYLKEEIIAEAETQNIPAFAEFLRIAALTSGKLLNYTNVAREAGINARVVRNYFQILEDTLLGGRLAPWKKVKNRRLIETEKFYLFDVGVANYLARRAPKLGTPEFGKSFEHYILMELKAYQAYRNPELEICYWRTSNGKEVDFILGEMDVALEVKASARIHEGDLVGFRTLFEEQKVKKAMIVSLEKEPRKITPKITVMPWQYFLKYLWDGELGV